MKNTYQNIEFFSDFFLRQESKETIIIGRTSINKYIEIPYDTIGIINDIYHQKIILDEYDNYEVEDIDEFIRNLIELNFIEYADGKKFESETINIDGISFPLITQDILKKIFTKKFFIALLIYLITIYSFIIAKHSDLFNLNYKQIFFSRSLLLITFTITILDFILVFLHEFSHFMAIRLLSGELGHVGIGRRLFYFVFQTKIDNIWILGKTKRIIVYLSGIICDLFILSLLCLCSIILKNGLLFSITRIAEFLLIVGILFEFKFYLKTDLYYLISDLSNSRNLMNESRMVLKNFFTKRKSKNIIASIYSILMIIGIFIEIAIVVLIGFPSFLFVLTQTIEDFMNSNWDYFFANLLVISLGTLEFILISYLFCKEKSSNLKLFFSKILTIRKLAHIGEPHPKS